MFTAPAGPRRDRPPAKRQVKSFTLRSRGGRLGSPQFGARGAACRTFLTLPKDHHASLVTKDRSRRAMLVCETPHVNPWSMTTRGSGASRCSCPGALAARGHGGCHPQRGWWESVTVTWSPAPAPDRRPAVLPRALGLQPARLLRCSPMSRSRVPGDCWSASIESYFEQDRCPAGDFVPDPLWF